MMGIRCFDPRDVIVESRPRSLGRTYPTNNVVQLVFELFWSPCRPLKAALEIVRVLSFTKTNLLGVLCVFAGVV